MKLLSLRFSTALLLPAVIKAPGFAQKDKHPKNGAEIYKATWKSLEKYQTPTWFRDAKFGIYTHWGPNTVADENASGVNTNSAMSLVLTFEILSGRLVF